MGQVCSILSPDRAAVTEDDNSLPFVQMNKSDSSGGALKPAQPVVVKSEKVVSARVESVKKMPPQSPTPATMPSTPEDGDAARAELRSADAARAEKLQAIHQKIPAKVAFKVGERVKITGNTSGGSDKFSAMLGAVVEARSGGAFGVRLDSGAGYTYFTEGSLQVTDEAPKAVEVSEEPAPEVVQEKNPFWGVPLPKSPKKAVAKKVEEKEIVVEKAAAPVVAMTADTEAASTAATEAVATPAAEKTAQPEASTTGNSKNKRKRNNKKKGGKGGK